VASRLEHIARHHDLIVELRSKGADLRAVASTLAGLGVRVDHNAVRRYLIERGLPTGRVKPDPPATSAPDTSTPDTATPTDPVRPEPLVGPSHIAARQFLPDPGTFSGPSARAHAVIGPLDVPIEVLPPVDLGVAPWLTSTPPPRRETPPPRDHDLPPSEAVRHADVLPRMTSVDQAVAEVVAACAEAVRRIEEAKRAHDLPRVRAEVSRAHGVLERAAPTLPPEAREMVKDALDAVVIQLGLSPEALTDPPPFAPLPILQPWPPDLELLSFGENGPVWTLQDAFEGVLILGATGSGKTSGSGKELARSFLDAHFGGLVLTVKEDERALWERYAAQTRRTPQLCVIKPGGSFKFNFLDYQARLPEEHGGSTENVVELLHTILEAYSKGRRAGENFWTNTSRQILRNMVRVMKAAGEPLDLRTMRQFLTEAPPSRREAADEHWKHTQTFGRLLLAAQSRGRGTPEEATLDEAYRYWTGDFPALYGETRSIVVTDFSSTVDLFFDPTLRDLFCGPTTLTPEAIFDGALLIVDLPVKKYLSVGRIAQIIWKHYAQLAIERRSSRAGDARRPVFLWADEAQEFITSYDAAFQATARGARCATVYLTQNMPGFYIRVGGDLPRERVDALVANLGTKILHANNDPTTNQWSAEQIGKDLLGRVSVSTTPASGGGQLNWILGKGGPLSEDAKTSSSINPAMDYLVQPSEFPGLRTGGARNDRMIDAWIVKNGGRFPPEGRHFFKATFAQESP
jgi:hypothetical protein